MKNYDVIIIGAGAAGFMAAIEAGKRSRTVLLLDSSKKIGEKIRISGGGRCNFTNIHTSYENYISQNPSFCRSALAQYPPRKFVELVDKHGIAYHEKKSGQLFCNNSSQEIINMLFSEAKNAGVEVCNPVIIGTIKQIDIKDQTANNSYNIGHSKKRFICVSENETWFCESVVIATGGLSIPQIGASDFGYRIAKQFGLGIISPTPGLVPLIVGDTHKLAGCSMDTEVSIGKIKFRENILFTHKGLSGPAILQISSYWSKGKKIFINLCPEINLYKFLTVVKNDENYRQKKLKNVLKDLVLPKKITVKLKNKIERKQILPNNYVEVLSEKFDLDTILAEYSNNHLQQIADAINNWELVPTTTEGFDKAEVTVGGVDTSYLNSKTMEVKHIPGLYFVGEVVDVTGWLGGYNFQWAWASGYLAGQNC